MTNPLILGAVFMVLTAVCLCRVMAQSVPTTTTQPAPQLGSADAIKLFVLQKVVARPFCFAGPDFPKCDFENPDAVAKLIGPYTITTTYYDSMQKKVDRSAGVGRYGAVVAIHHSDGKISQRFLTLFQINPVGNEADLSDAKRWIKAAGGVDDKVLQDHPEYEKLIARMGAKGLATNAVGAIILAGMHELGDRPTPPDIIDTMDRQWWVDFKRTYYGYDKLYPHAFTCPNSFDGPPAPMVHEGTLAEAGMKADTVAKIDAAANAWVDEMKIGFNFCVVRHGVVILNKGYGLQAEGDTPDAPYKADTAGPLASTTKFLSSLLLAEFVDQGMIDLDQPFEKYIPTMRGLNVKTPMTVRDGYLHLGGFQDHWGDEMHDLEEVVGDLYPALDVGAKFHYEGTSLALGGKIMENMSGETLSQLYRIHLFGPLGCDSTVANLTSYGSKSTAMDLTRIGQMALNGGAYGHQRFFSPATLQKFMPLPGKERLEPKDNSIRWGVGIKQFDIDGFSEKAFGHPGATGSCLVIDPEHDLVIAMTRFEEGGRFVDFLKKKSVMYKAVLDSIDVK